MGACISTKHSRFAPPLPPIATAKLILSDGSLLQFSIPVTPSHVLGNDQAEFFVCDSDSMEVDRELTGVGKELRLGQIYFTLPRSMLNRPLKGKQMADLAVRASVALVEAESVGTRGRRGVVAPLDFAAEEKEAEKGGGKAFKFVPNLRAIPE